MQIQGMVLGAIAILILILSGSLWYCIDDNLDQRAKFAKLTQAVKDANAENKRRKEERENENRQNQQDSDERFETMRSEYESRLAIMHHDRNKWLDKYYPTAGEEAKGLPPLCFDRGEFNKSLREAETENSRIADKGEKHRLNLIEARKWADRQRWDRVKKEEKKEGNLILEFIN